MLGINDLKVGMRVRVRDLSSILDTLIFLENTSSGDISKSEDPLLDTTGDILCITTNKDELPKTYRGKHLCIFNDSMDSSWEVWYE